METKKIDTTYNGFSFVLQELSTQLNQLQSQIAKADNEEVIGNMFVNQAVHDVLDALSCVLRDLPSGAIDYTNKPSSFLNISDKSVLLLAISKASASIVNVIDDYYVEKLYSPVYVARHKANGSQFWCLSNVANELSLLLYVTHRATTLLASSTTVVEA